MRNKILPLIFFMIALVNLYPQTVYATNSTIPKDGAIFSGSYNAVRSDSPYTSFLFDGNNVNVVLNGFIGLDMTYSIKNGNLVLSDETGATLLFKIKVSGNSIFITLPSFGLEMIPGINLNESNLTYEYIRDYVPPVDTGTDDSNEETMEESILDNADILIKAIALSQLSYDNKLREYKGKEIKDFPAYPDGDKHIWDGAFENLTNEFFYKSIVGNIKVLYSSPQNSYGTSGFNATSFYDKEKNTVYIVYRGTDSLVDWGQGYYYTIKDWISSQYEHARGFYWNDVIYKLDEEGIDKPKIIICGHSLGGALANSISMQTGDPSIAVNGATGWIINNIYTANPFFADAWFKFKGIDKWNFINHITEKGMIADFNNFVAHQNLKKYKNIIYRQTYAVNGTIANKHSAMSMLDYVNGKFVIGHDIEKNLLDEHIKDINKIEFNSSNSLDFSGIAFGTSTGDLIESNMNYLYGGDGDDTIHCNTIMATFIGGEGNDSLYANSSSNNPGDRYFIYQGQGMDTIYDTGGKNDQIILAGYDTSVKQSFQFPERFSITDDLELYAFISLNGENIVKIAHFREDPIKVLFQNTDGSLELIKDWQIKLDL
jgi:hypothetical protein